MFGSLKKRLKSVVKKFSESVKEEPKEEIPKEEPAIEEKVEEKPAEKPAEAPAAPEPETEKEKEEEKPAEPEPEKKEEPKPEPKPVEEKPVEAPEPEKKVGFIKKLFKRVEEKQLSEKEINKILGELQKALLENDVAYRVSEIINEDVKKELLNKSVKRSEVEKIVTNALKTAMLHAMSQEELDLDEMISKSEKPFLIIFFGFNGTGKTTTIAKLAHKFKKYKPILAAGDTFRSASIEQLEVHSKKIGLEVIKHDYGADSAAVIFDAVKHASAVKSKLVLADTAGRSHSNVNLMDELKKVVRVNKPDMKILVLDSITGNDIYEQSKLFNEAVGADAIILTKADVYEKGGACLSATRTINKPVLYLGVGQEYDDLKEFKPEEIVNNLLG